MARKKNTEAPVTEEVKTQDPTVTSLFLSVTGYRRIINKRSTSTIDTQK